MIDDMPLTNKFETAPAYEAVESVPTLFQLALLNDSSPYQGWPDDDKDQLWQDMYSSMYELFPVQFKAKFNP